MSGFIELPKRKGLPRAYSAEQIADAAFDHFRKTGFPYPNLPIHVCMQEINKLRETEDSSLLGTTTAYKVADTYHPHRFEAAAQNMKSPVQAHSKDEDLRKAIKLDLQHFDRIKHWINSLALVNGTQGCSNFRPGFALLMYRKFCQPGDKVLDTSTGYGGRLVGFLASECSGYLGFDPNRPTYEGNMRLVNDLAAGKRVHLFNQPIEDAPPEKFAETCDFAFTSPPYFSKELYSDDDTQSWKRYPTFFEWCKGFLLPMMRFQFAALKPGAYSCVNVADVKIGKERHPLSARTQQAGVKAGFEFKGERAFGLARRFGKGMKEGVAKEPVLVFRKPG